MKFPEYFTAQDRRMEPEQVLRQKIDAILRAMTTAEKLSFCHGAANPTDVGQIANAGYLPGLPRLGVPEIRMYDGPAGVTAIYDTTGLPCQQLLASTWSKEQAYQYGAVMGRENTSVSGNFQLGSQFDVTRIPHFGRSHDMLGEDQMLVSALAVSETQGIQDQGAVATLKHFAGFAQSANPTISADVHIDEQTLHEVYLRPFEAACKEGGAGSVMCTYSKINSEWASANPYLQKYVLRDLWDFRGFIMSDWGATHQFCTHLGMDVEMPQGMYNSDERILRSIENGTMTWADVDDVCRHVLWGLASCGYLAMVQMDDQGKVLEEPGRTAPIRMPYTYFDDVKDGMLDRHARACYEVAAKGMTLLKNENRMLPLKKEDSVAVIGLSGVHLISGYDQERSFGRISRMVSPAEALKQQLPSVVAAVGIDMVGVPIPAECWYQDKSCTNHGLLRTYGITEEDGVCPSVFGPGGGGQEFKGGPVLEEDDDCGEETAAFGPPSGGTSAAADMPGHETGTAAAVDAEINFTCGTIDGKINQTYKNSSDGTAFHCGEAYTWKGCLRVSESGVYTLSLQAIGGQAAFRICLDGQEFEFVGNTNTREGSHWAWTDVVPTPEGMDIVQKDFHLEAAKVYPVIMYGRATLPHKDLQLRAAWVTPEQKRRDYAAALDAAKRCKKVLFFAHGKKEAESSMMEFPVTLTSLELPEAQKQLLHQVISAAQKAGNQVCVCVSGGIPVTMGNWIHEVDSVLQLWLPGQEGGRAVADILTGKVCPSGKLPQSLPAFDKDTPVSDTPEHRIRRHDGYCDDANQLVVDYDEGIFFGYRWYDKEQIKPLFPFGHGLSYTTFAYQNAAVKQNGAEVTVSVDVTNTGDIAGDEIVQVYLSGGQVPAYAMLAEKQLAAFCRLEEIAPGETRHVVLKLPPQSLCYWDIEAGITETPWGTKGKWRYAAGTRQVLVGGNPETLEVCGNIVIKN